MSATVGFPPRTVAAEPPRARNPNRDDSIGDARDVPFRDELEQASSDKADKTTRKHDDDVAAAGEFDDTPTRNWHRSDDKPASPDAALALALGTQPPPMQSLIQTTTAPKSGGGEFDAIAAAINAAVSAVATPTPTPTGPAPELAPLTALEQAVHDLISRMHSDGDDDHDRDKQASAPSDAPIDAPLTAPAGATERAQAVAAPRIAEVPGAREIQPAPETTNPSHVHLVLEQGGERVVMTVAVRGSEVNVALRGGDESTTAALARNAASLDHALRARGLDLTEFTAERDRQAREHHGDPNRREPERNATGETFKIEETA